MKKKRCPCYQCIIYIMCKNSFKESSGKSLIKLIPKCPDLKGYLTEETYKGPAKLNFNKDRINKVCHQFKWDIIYE